MPASTATRPNPNRTLGALMYDRTNGLIRVASGSTRDR